MLGIVVRDQDRLQLAAERPKSKITPENNLSRTAKELFERCAVVFYSVVWRHCLEVQLFLDLYIQRRRFLEVLLPLRDATETRFPSQPIVAKVFPLSRDFRFPETPLFHGSDCFRINSRALCWQYPRGRAEETYC